MSDEKVKMTVERLTLHDGSIIEIRTVKTWAPDEMLAVSVQKNGDISAVLAKNIGTGKKGEPG